MSRRFVAAAFAVLSVLLIRAEQVFAQSCTYVVSPLASTVGANGGGGLVVVTPSNARCAWTAASPAAWITLNPLRGYAGRVLADGATAYWRLGEPGGSATVADSSGRGPGGTLLGGVRLREPGALSDGDAAAAFDGTGSIAVAPSPSLTGTTAMSVEAWVKTPGTWARVAGAAGDGWELWVADGGGARLRLLGQTVTSVRTVADNRWHHVVGTWDGTVAAIYVDGALENQIVLPGTLEPTVGGLMIGAHPAYGGSLVGALDDVAVYPRALTPLQVAAHYGLRTSLATTGSGVVGYLVSPNTASASRTATLAVAGQSVRLGQDGAAARACTFAVTPSPVTSAAGGGMGLVTVTASDPRCTWTASGTADWIDLGHVVRGYAGRVVADGAIGYWRLGEAAGSTTASDFSGYGLDGTLWGGVTLQQPGASGDGDTAAAFDGTGGISVPPSAAMAVTTAFTIEAWVKTPNTWSRVVGSDSNAWELWVGEGQGQLRLLGQVVTSVRMLVTDNNWHHLAGTWDGTVATIYVDGVAERQIVVQGTVSESENGLTIGAPHTYGGWVDGSIDEVALYDQALTPQQVAAHVALRTNPGTAGSGVVGFDIDPNPSSPRQTSLAVAGQTVPVAQEGTSDNRPRPRHRRHRHHRRCYHPHGW